jgi:hypothetical protein
MTAYINYSTTQQQQKKDEDDEMSLADIMSLRISTTPIEEKVIIFRVFLFPLFTHSF